MSDDIQLDAYLERIGHYGPLQPTADTLRQLHLHHPLSIAFENLDPLSRRPVKLDPSSLQEKLVRRRRGGYCYEHNLLFAAVLRRLGFTVRGRAARVLWNRPEGTIGPRTHMVLQVDIAEAGYLADVGFGGLTLTAPLRLVTDTEQATPHEVFRLTAANGGYVVQARLNGQWQPLYWFDPQEYLLPDYELGNWYVSTHPDSLFVNHLLAGRAGPDCRYALLDDMFTVHRLRGGSQTRRLADVDDLRRTLVEIFGIALDELPGADDVLRRLMAAEPREVEG
jgi:N-hydroxyarylamine O-acetyltransferase